MSKCSTTEPTREAVLDLARSWVSFSRFADHDKHYERGAELRARVFQLLTSLLNWDYDHATDYITAEYDRLGVAS